MSIEHITAEDVAFIEEGKHYATNATEKEIYEEATIAGFWVTTGLNPVNNWNIVERVSKPTPSQIAEQLVIGHLGGKDSFYVDTTDARERNSVSVAIRRVMKREKKRFTIKTMKGFFGLTIEKRTGNTDYRRLVASLPNIGEFHITESDRYLPSAKSQIYRIARDFNLTITIKGRDVIYSPDKPKSQFDKLSEFVQVLPMDCAMSLPTEISAIPDLRVLISRLPFECSYRNGMITKHSYRLCNRAGGVELRTTGKVLTRIENLRISGITDYHRTLMNTELVHHGIRLNDNNEVEKCA